MSPKTVMVALGILSLYASIAVATDGPETLLGRRLLEIPQLREEIIASAGRTAAPGTGSEIAMVLFREDVRIWKALESELPPLLAQRIPRERLEALARSYGENPEREWDQSGAEIRALVWSLVAEDSQLRKEIARSACSAGFLAPNIDSAREKAGKAGTPFKAKPGFFEAIQPIFRPIDETCDCLMRHAAEASEDRFFFGQMPREEAGAWMAQLITSGKCPDPFATSR